MNREEIGAQSQQYNMSHYNGGFPYRLSYPSFSFEYLLRSETASSSAYVPVYRMIQEEIVSNHLTVL